MFFFGQFMGGDTTHADVGGEEFSIELDDAGAGGIGYGFNLNNHINLNTDLLYGKGDIRSHYVSSDSNLIGVDINLDLNLLKSRLTPLISGGVGTMRFKGDIGGYDFDETDFSYNVGAGFRCDVTNHLLIKAVYRSLWTKLEDTEEALRMDVVAVSIGYIF